MVLNGLRTRLTYANVMATIAVFIALGGTSYAAVKVGSREIRNNSVRSGDIRNNNLTNRDVRNGSLLRRDFKAGQLPAGPPGAAGAPGRQGPKGDPGATNVVVRATDSPMVAGAGSVYTRVDCQAGEKATGGGAVRVQTNGAGADVAFKPGDVVGATGPFTRSPPRPSTPGQTPDSWVSAFAYTTGSPIGADTFVMRHYVICVRP